MVEVSECMVNRVYQIKPQSFIDGYEDIIQERILMWDYFLFHGCYPFEDIDIGITSYCLGFLAQKIGNVG